jgi:hypothetical protein
LHSTLSFFKENPTLNEIVTETISANNISSDV